jgi:hypothetical protein
VLTTSFPHLQLNQHDAITPSLVSSRLVKDYLKGFDLRGLDDDEDIVEEEETKVTILLLIIIVCYSNELFVQRMNSSEIVDEGFLTGDPLALLSLAMDGMSSGSSSDAPAVLLRPVPPLIPSPALLKTIRARTRGEASSAAVTPEVVSHVPHSHFHQLTLASSRKRRLPRRGRRTFTSSSTSGAPTRLPKTKTTTANRSSLSLLFFLSIFSFVSCSSRAFPPPCHRRPSSG